MSDKTAKILLVVGILFLIGSLLQVLNSYYWKGSLPMLLIGWYLTILGAVSINPRASAWTFLLMGFYLWFIFAETLDGSDLGIYIGSILLFIVVGHILLGLIVGIESFRKGRKDKNAIYNKNSTMQN